MSAPEPQPAGDLTPPRKPPVGLLTSGGRPRPFPRPLPRPSLWQHFALFVPVWSSLTILVFLLLVAPFPTVTTLLFAGSRALYDRQWIPRPEFLFERRTWLMAILAGTVGQVLRAAVDGLVLGDLAWQLITSVIIGSACGLFVMWPLALCVATADALRIELRRHLPPQVR